RLVERPRDGAAGPLEEPPAAAAQALRLVVVEAGRADRRLELPRRALGEGARVGVLREEPGRDEVDARVGALRRQDGRDEQLGRARVGQRAGRVAVLAREARDNLAGAGALLVGGLAAPGDALRVPRGGGSGGAHESSMVSSPLRPAPGRAAAASEADGDGDSIRGRRGGGARVRGSPPMSPRRGAPLRTPRSRAGPKLRIAVVGLGIGRSHVVGLLQPPALAEICALCDHNRARLRRVGEEFGVAARYADFEEMLAKEAPDAVVVATPNDLHAPIAVAAL